MWHKRCYKCSDCRHLLSASTCHVLRGRLYCKHCLVEATRLNSITISFAVFNSSFKSTVKGECSQTYPNNHLRKTTTWQKWTAWSLCKPKWILILKNHPMNKDCLWITATFCGPKGGCCSQVWLYITKEEYFISTIQWVLLTITINSWQENLTVFSLIQKEAVFPLSQMNKILI